MNKQQNYHPNIARLKHRHNRIKRRLTLGQGKPGDEGKLAYYEKVLGYGKTAET